MPVGTKMDIEERLRLIETRLSDIEHRVEREGSDAAPMSKTEAPSEEKHPPPPPGALRKEPLSHLQMNPAKTEKQAGLDATAILGWSGVAALVLATSYLIRLAIDAGWLTPVRQMTIAALFGGALIVSGFLIKERNRRYASLLPAGGIVVLFLADYGAHLYHNLIGPLPATVGVIGICFLTLVLGRIFKSEWYALFAVIGSYTGPIFLQSLRSTPSDLSIYFVGWGLLYCWYAITSKQRTIYLLAGYLSFIIFDAVWKMGGLSDWTVALAFQFIQFVLFAGTTVAYSIKNRDPLDEQGAIAHLPLLLLFYFVQYMLLKQHLSDWAPWIAFASMAVLMAAYGTAKGRLRDSLAGGHLLVTVYTAIVLFHAGYLELIPEGWAPWVGLSLLIISGLHLLWQQAARKWWPLYLAVGLIFVQNDGRLMIGWNLAEVYGYQMLVPLYAAALYAGYWIIKNKPELAVFKGWLLYLGHLNAMAGATHIFDGRLVISLAWAMTATFSLVISIRSRDLFLGRSALFIFAGLGAKILLFDLSTAAPLIRIGCLIVLGLALYGGGLLYQRINEFSES